MNVNANVFSANLFVNFFFIVVCINHDDNIHQPNNSPSDSCPLQFHDMKKEVILTSVIFRHGDRTPICPYPNDPYKNESHWTVKFGQLTSIGKEQQRTLGAWLRSKYSHLLSDSYDPNEIYVMSTDVKRVQESAEYCLYGLYPEQSVNRNNFRISVIPAEYDNILGVRRRCPKYEDELQKVFRSQTVRELDQAHAELYAYLTKHSGQNVTSFTDVACIYDALNVQSLHNKTLPEWSQNISLKKLECLTIARAMAMVNSTQMKRFKSGLLLKDILDHAKAKIKDEFGLTRKMWMYSAHDDTIMNMLMALGVFKPHCPTYAALIGIELRHNESRGYFITIFYKAIDKEPVYLKLKNCDLECPLEQFQQLMEPLMIHDWETECAL